MKNKFWPSNSSEWIEVGPEEQGLDSKKIAAMFEFIEKNSYDIHSVIVVRNGYLLVEEYLHNSTVRDTKSYFEGKKIHMQQSATKSLISILIGIALQKSFLNNLNQTLYEFFADIWDPEFVDSEQKKDITIEQLLTMNAGLVGYGPSYPAEAKDLMGADCINWALNLVPLRVNPGKAGFYEYSNDGTNLLSAIIAKVASMSTEKFAQEYLFTPLGISTEEYYWWHDDKGISYGGYGLECSPKVQAKLGILCLNNGTWNRTQIVGEDYMKSATTVKISPSKGGVSVDCGYLFYMMDSPFKGYYMAGAGGQLIYVIPEYNITVGFTAGGIPKEGYNNLLKDYVLQFAEDS